MSNNPGRGGTERSSTSLTAAAALVLLTLALYWPVAGFEFLTYDDDRYVTGNLHVQQGLSRESVVWAASSFHASNWHPLTWISHMLDVQLFGLDAGKHHLVNLLIHTANGLLIFVLFARMTGALWSSALVAALFSLHPLHVESVAWVAERKDVLSTLFGLASAVFYLRFMRKRRTVDYLLALFSYAAGLMAKPMLVTLPLLFFVLDYWPLGRWERAGGRTFSAALATAGSARRLCGEKIPFLILAVLSGLLTLIAQREGGALAEQDPLTARAANAFVSYLIYLGKTLWPVRLTFFYPHPGASLPLWQSTAAGALLALILAAALRQKRRPYLGAGWFWFLLALGPVIGIVQVGAQARADRYTYLPLTGLFLTMVWGGSEILGERRRHRALAAGLMACVLIALFVVARAQLGHWRSSETLFRHALEVTSGNHTAHIALGELLGRSGRKEEALGHFREAVKIAPTNTIALYNLGTALLFAGNLTEAKRYLEAAVGLRHKGEAAHFNLGLAYAQGREFDRAVVQFQMAVRLNPSNAMTYQNLGTSYLKLGRSADAEAAYREALRLDRKNAEVFFLLGNALQQQGRAAEAVAAYRQALQIAPDRAGAREALQQALENGRCGATSPAQVIQ